MTKIALRLLILSIFATSLLAAPLVTEVSAATSSKHIKKKRVRVMHQSPRVAGPSPSANPYSTDRYGDDPDRRAGGGGGGY